MITEELESLIANDFHPSQRRFQRIGMLDDLINAAILHFIACGGKASEAMQVLDEHLRICAGQVSRFETEQHKRLSPQEQFNAEARGKVERAAVLKDLLTAAEAKKLPESKRKTTKRKTPAQERKEREAKIDKQMAAERKAEQVARDAKAEAARLAQERPRASATGRRALAAAERQAEDLRTERRRRQADQTPDLGSIAEGDAI